MARHLSKAERIIRNLAEMSREMPRLHARIFAAGLRRDYAQSVQLQRIETQYRIGMCAVALQLLDPFSWIPGDNIHVR